MRLEGTPTPFTVVQRYGSAGAQQDREYEYPSASCMTMTAPPWALKGHLRRQAIYWGSTSAASPRPRPARGQILKILFDLTVLAFSELQQ